MTETLKKKTAKGVLWSSFERFSVQGVMFVVMIVMARRLTPNDYGLIGMLTIFISVSQSLINSGFSQALIRKQNRTEVDNSTAFYYNICVGFFLYLILFICAPLIADFYNEPSLTALTRVLGLSIIFNSFTIVQQSLLSQKIDFRTLAKASFISAISSGFVGISLTYLGFGVWSIVAQQLVNLGLNAILLWILSGWKPKWTYSWTSFRELFGFGSKLLASGLLETLYQNIYLIVIGKIFKASELGYYTRAYHFSTFPSSNITGVLQRVTYPILCTLQDDNIRLASVYRRFLRISAFIVFPLMVGLSAVAKPMVLFMLNEQWLYSATLLQIICFGMMWYPIHSINLNLLQVKGRSDLFLRLEILKKIIGIIILCITIPLGLIAMCYGTIVSSLLSLVINTYYTGKLIRVGFIRQMMDLFPTLMLSLIMGIVVYITISKLNIHPGLQLLIGVIEGVIIYISASKIFGFAEFKEITEIIHNNK
jgi:O-antigen/teichoic acid export membrane protein